jgi:hypothetical protein
VLQGNYDRDNADDLELCEYFVPVDWLHTMAERDRPVSPLWRSSRVTCYAAWAA